MTDTVRARLIVQNVDQAIAYYEKAIGARPGMRHTDSSGLVVHAEVFVGDDMFTMATEVEEWGLLSPVTLGGSPTLLTLTVDDAPAVGEAMVQNGGQVIVPIEDRPYGRCEGRVRDPFGHLWVVSHVFDASAGSDAG